MKWPVDVMASGALEGGTLLWTHQGVFYITLILRTTYALKAGPPLPVATCAVENADRHYLDDPARAVRTGADVAPRIPRAEIVHAGAVIAPAGITMARLALRRQSQSLFDKRLLATTKNDGTGLGPFGRAAPERLAALQGTPEPTTAANGALELPNDFDFSFYQTAPVDQQVGRVFGGDEIVLGNLHPQLADLTITIPSCAPAARAMLGAEEALFVLECKRVVLDTDRLDFTLVWYAELQLPSLEVVPYLRIEARPPPYAPPVDLRELLHRIAASPPLASTAMPIQTRARPGMPLEIAPSNAHAGTVIAEESPVHPRIPPLRPPSEPK